MITTMITLSGLIIAWTGIRDLLFPSPEPDLSWIDKSGRFEWLIDPRSRADHLSELGAWGAVQRDHRRSLRRELVRINEELESSSLTASREAQLLTCRTKLEDMLYESR